jgi:hypothetical protein
LGIAATGNGAEDAAHKERKNMFEKLLLVAVLIQAGVPVPPAGNPEIVVSAVSPTPWKELLPLAEPHPRPDLENRSAFQLKAASFSEFIRPEEMTRIDVDRYDPGILSLDSVKSQLQLLTTSTHIEGMFPKIIWSEFTIWSSAATITFKSGKHGRIVFDYLHVCYEDPDGIRWFFRYGAGPR